MEKRRLQIWLPLLLSASMALGVFFGFKMRDGFPGKSFFYREQRSPLQEVVDLINKKYVDSVDAQMLADTAIAALITKLDPHSAYISAGELEAVNEDINGNFYGIGIEYNIISDTMHVVSVFKDGPAEKAGILVGDKLLKANDSALTGRKITGKFIRTVMRGPAGSKLTLQLMSKGSVKNISLLRDAIPLYTMDAAYMIDSTMGYIKLSGFSKQTYREFMLALELLKKQNLKKLILDLRGNGGGVLDEAVEIADEFLAGDKLITYTEGLHVKRKELRCRRTGQFENGPLVVLADEGTASASEVLLGALQDWDRATIVGRRSFGKGLVQEQFNLSNRSALRLTVARYFTPVGRSIQRSYANGKKAYYGEITSRYHNGSMLSADSVHVDTSKVFYTKNGKKVYGGDGISPDVFVPADSNRIDSSNNALWRRGLLGDFGYIFLINHPAVKTSYSNAAQFNQTFKIDDNTWNFFVQQAHKDSIDLKQIKDSRKTYLMRYLKASIARQLFKLEGYYQSMNTEDKTFLKAKSILSQ